jgi:uncharacterized membrane protein
MGNSNSRWLVLAGGIAAVFVATIAILVNVIPRPHRNLDYLVIGAVATFLSMILLWVALMQQGAKPKE